ncbi:MAG: U32 family peptidase, partial [Leptospiraceae bacterium]|nr:U32 family peptidase [Leptospiraceae bacterium]
MIGRPDPSSRGPVSIVAPAGNHAMVAAALQAGADAIYFGVENLNLRNQASGAFGLEDIAQITRKCHRFHAGAYLTLNSVIYDRDIRLVQSILDAAKLAAVDAVIASDPAVIEEARTRNLTVHLSTQVSVSNLAAVRFWARYADVIVLARELDLSMIARIVAGIEAEDIRGPSGQRVQIEVFGHGALCIAVSGRCGMSLYSDLASANRGACRQNCRRKYRVIDERGVELEIDNEYIMSPNDICTLPFLNRVVESGIAMLKIEGRNRGPDYVSNTVSVY